MGNQREAARKDATMGTGTVASAAAFLPRGSWCLERMIVTRCEAGISRALMQGLFSAGTDISPVPEQNEMIRKWSSRALQSTAHLSTNRLLHPPLDISVKSHFDLNVAPKTPLQLLILYITFQTQEITALHTRLQGRPRLFCRRIASYLIWR